MINLAVALILSSEERDFDGQNSNILSNELNNLENFENITENFYSDLTLSISKISSSPIIPETPPKTKSFLQKNQDPDSI